MKDKLGRFIKGHTYRHSEESKRKMSIVRTKPKTKIICLNCKKEFGVWPSRAKIGVKYCSKKCIIGIRGNKHYKWKGNKADQHTKHNWLHRYYGSAYMCQFNPAHKRRFEWANLSGEYERDINDWIMLCARCHRRFDMGWWYCRKGHLFTIENTIVRRNGKRKCRICEKNWHQKYVEKNRKRLKEYRHKWYLQNKLKLSL